VGKKGKTLLKKKEGQAARGGGEGIPLKEVVALTVKKPSGR